MRQPEEPFSGQRMDDYYPPSFGPDNAPWAKHQRLGIRLVSHMTDESKLMGHKYISPVVAEQTNVIRFPVERTRPPEDLVA